MTRWYSKESHRSPIANAKKLALSSTDVSLSIPALTVCRDQNSQKKKRYQDTSETSRLWRALKIAGKCKG